MSDTSAFLPENPSLEQLKKQAKELLRAFLAGDANALARITAHKPNLASQDTIQAALADAQFAIAREYGFASWPRLKQHVEFVQRPTDFHEPTWGTNTWPFLMAVYEGRTDTVRQMLRDDPTLARAEYAYLQPLHYAVMAGRLEMVTLLLDAGANPLAEGWSGKPLGDDTPLTRAGDRELPDIVRVLSKAALEPLAPMPNRPERPPNDLGKLEIEMSGFGHRGDIKGALKLLEKHPGLAYAGLYEAVHQGHTKLARILLERGADPTRPWRWACWLTPLMHSLRYARPNYEMASMLMEYGVKPDGRNGMGMPTLHILVGLGTVEAAAWLLDRGADINLRDLQFQSTPLAWAARFGRLDMARLLLTRGAKVELPDDEPWATPGAWARRRGHPEILTLL